AHDTTSLVLGGIDGLYWYDGTLVAIENGMWPQRVIRLTLGKDGKSITKMMPLDVANPAFDVPTTGTIAGDGLYYIANSQKGLYGKYGDLKDDAALQPVRIFRSNLRFAWDKNGINAGGMQPVQQATPEEGRRMIQEGPRGMNEPAPAVSEKKSD
ncbi:MAG TPA: hypothetical protein VFN25_15165, partial [Dokdonella sp.]|uniref:hypothetical protein n=1 Tax=Dokdonella sp. TaxID=2291710 RepID=UPI002D806F0D